MHSFVSNLGDVATFFATIPVIGGPVARQRGPRVELAPSAMNLPITTTGSSICPWRDGGSGRSDPR